MITPETLYSCENAYYREAEFGVKTTPDSSKRTVNFPLLSSLIMVAFCVALTAFLMGEANKKHNQDLITRNQVLHQKISTFQAQKQAYCEN
jgi:hypothetical protein